MNAPKLAPESESKPSPYLVTVIALEGHANSFEFSDLDKAIKFAKNEDREEGQRVLVIKRKFVHGALQEFCVDLT